MDPSPSCIPLTPALIVERPHHPQVYAELQLCHPGALRVPLPVIDIIVSHLLYPGDARQHFPGGAVIVHKEKVIQVHQDTELGQSCAGLRHPHGVEANPMPGSFVCRGRQGSRVSQVKRSKTNPEHPKCPMIITLLTKTERRSISNPLHRTTPQLSI